MKVSITSRTVRIYFANLKLDLNELNELEKVCSFTASHKGSNYFLTSLSEKIATSKEEIALRLEKDEIAAKEKMLRKELK